MFEDGAEADDAGRTIGVGAGKFVFWKIRNCKEHNDEDGCFCELRVKVESVVGLRGEWGRLEWIEGDEGLVGEEHVGTESVGAEALDGDVCVGEGGPYKYEIGRACECSARTD